MISELNIKNNSETLACSVHNTCLYLEWRKKEAKWVQDYDAFEDIRRRERVEIL